MHYDFDAFLNGVKYLDKQDILDTAYKKHKALDKSSAVYTPAARSALQNSIADLLYWLEKGERPAGISDVDFAKLKPICENLIRKGEMEKEALELFEEVES